MSMITFVFLNISQRARMYRTDKPVPYTTLLLTGLSRHGACIALAKAVKEVKYGLNGFNVVLFSGARIGSLMLGYGLPGGIKDVIEAKPKLGFFLGADEVDFAALPDTFKVYVGHHGDKGAHAADVILPAAAWTDRKSTRLNSSH